MKLPDDELRTLGGALLEAARVHADENVAGLAGQYPDHQVFVEMARCEVTAAIAIHAVINVHLSRAATLVQQTPKEDRNHHALQSIVNPFIGSIMAFATTMPERERRMFFKTYFRQLDEALRKTGLQP